jgi:exosortase
MTRDREAPVRAIVAGAIILALLGFVFSNFFTNQFRFAITQPADWGHTLLVPFMAGYLVWIRRHDIAPPRTTWPALLLVVLGIGWYVFCWMGPMAMRHHNLMAAGFGATLVGLLLLFVGFRAMRYLWFPVIFVLVFGVTISTRFMNIITEPLQDLAAKGAFVVLRVAQFDADLNGNTISIWHKGEMHPLNVAEACSGMRMVVAFLALAVFMATLCLTHAWQRILLVLLAVPIALLVNILRVVSLGVLGLVNPGFSTGDFHSFVGFVWLIPGLFLFYGVIWVLRRLVIDGETGASAGAAGPSEGRRGARFSLESISLAAVIGACVTLVACGVGFRTAVTALNIYLQKRPIELRRDLALIPSRLGEWVRVGDDLALDKATIETLGTEDYLSRPYAREGVGGLMVHVAYYTDQIDAVPHVPERCFAAAGRTAVGGARHLAAPIDTSTWREDERTNRRTGRPYMVARATNAYTGRWEDVRMPVLPEGGELELRVWQFQESRNPSDRILAAYFFIANGCATSRAEDIRKLAFDRTDAHAYYMKIEFSSVGSGEGAIDEFVGQVGDLLTSLLPELMRCLPDWSEVELSEQSADGDGSPGERDQVETQGAM